MDDEKQNGVHGSCPEFGAIFMSNNATKKECLRRKVFALPSSQSHFVRQVKAGMILFLFEFERRELHGVFQACCDGDMNILPHAFSSSGKQFPAQVEFTTMWYCHPLSENEFRDAIRENYFSKYKFKFGLSEDQVRRLLLLFNMKRVKGQAPQRQLTRSKVARPSGYSRGKIRRVVDNDRSPKNKPGERDVDNHHGPVISTMHHGDSFNKDNRATNDGRFGTYTDVGYEHRASVFLHECFWDLMGEVGGNVDAAECATTDRLDIERNTGIELRPAASVGCSLGNFRSISDNVRFTKSDRFETECYKDNGFSSTISTAYLSSTQPKVNSPAYSRKHVQERDSFIHDPARSSSTFLPSIELQSSNISYPRTFEDSIITASLPYDPDVPNMNYQDSSSLGFNQGHASLQEHASRDNFAGSVLGTSKDQSFPSFIENRRTTISPDVNSSSRDFIPFPYPNQYEHSSRASLLRHAYSDDMAAEYCNKEKDCCGDISLRKPSLAPVPYSDMRNNSRMSEHSSSYRTSPGKFPSLISSDRYPALFEEKHECQVPEGDVFMFKECQHHKDSFYNDDRATEHGRFATYKYVESVYKEGQRQLHVHEPPKIDYHEVASLGPAAYQNSDCLYPNRQQKRSVFSRIVLPPKGCEQESNTAPGTADIDRNTVNEVMDMLHRSHYHWMKPRSKQLVKQHENAVTFRDNKQATKEGSAMISKEMNLKPIPFSKENSCQNTEETTFLDFKRRSAVRKDFEDGKTGSESLENKTASASQGKRRKLIRPNFCENQPSKMGISGDAPENVIASSTGYSLSKNAESVKLSVCHVNEDISQNVKLPKVTCETAVEGNIDKGSGSNWEQFSMGSFIALRSADEGGKESSENHGVSSMTSVCSGDMHTGIKQDLSTGSLGMDGFVQDCNNGSHSIHESSLKVCEDNESNGVAKSEFFCKIEQINDFCPVGGEISISNVN